VIHSLCAKQDCADGVIVDGGLSMDAAGNLYGTAAGGVGSARGSVFELTP